MTVRGREVGMRKRNVAMGGWGVPFVTHRNPRASACMDDGVRERAGAGKTCLATFAHLHPNPFFMSLSCVGSKMEDIVTQR